MKHVSAWSFLTIATLLAFCTSTTAVLADDATDSDSDSWTTNHTPVVRIVTPDDGQAFLVHSSIHICAISLGFTDAVTQVEFLAGTNTIATVTNGSNATIWGEGELADPFDCITWSNAVAGAYALEAIATDASGNSVTSAPVNISVVTNLPPKIRIVKPGEDDRLILGPTNIMICASAYDPDGTIASVTFFNGTNNIGSVTSTPPVWVTNSHCVFPVRQSEFCITWSNVDMGSYTLRAEATDNGGATSTSAPVVITVVTDLPPVVKILEPENNETFCAPAKINIYAGAYDPDGSVASVQFFAGATSLGTATNGYTITNDCGVVQTVYSVTWSNAAAGKYKLDAVATDNVGLMSTSGPVHITVLPPPPPQVKIIYPDKHDRFTAPATVPITAVTRFFTNPIAYVKFLANAKLLGVISNSWSPTFYWTNVSAGNYSLTVTATDTNGVTAKSPAVSITVANPPPGKAHGHDKDKDKDKD